MNISNQMKTMGIIWLFTGGGITIWAAVQLWQIIRTSSLGLDDSGFKIGLVILTLSVICIGSAIGLMKNKYWASILIMLISFVVLFCATLYYYFGGFARPKITDSLVVAGLALLSLSTLAILYKSRN